VPRNQWRKRKKARMEVVAGLEAVVPRPATIAARKGTLPKIARMTVSRATTERSSTRLGLSTDVVSTAEEWVISLQIAKSPLVTRRVTTAGKRGTLPRIVPIPRLRSLQVYKETRSRRRIYNVRDEEELRERERSQNIRG